MTAPTTDLLAPWTYRSEEFLALEIERLFRRRWLLVGHVSDLPTARDYLTLDVGGERALVLRGDDGNLRAFHNICRHRGARLVDGARGRLGARGITCPFHGWTYRHDGALIGVPAAESFGRLDKAAHGLAPLAMEVWMGFILVRFAGDGGESMATQMAPVAELLAPYRLAEMQPLADTYVVQLRPYNWKAIHDIDNEAYHVPGGHPALQQLYGDDYRDELVGGVPVSRARLNDAPGRLWSVRHYQKLLPEFAHLPPELRRTWVYVGLFPNMVLALYPDCMEFYMTLPAGVGETRFVGGGYALADSRREVQAVRWLNARINYITDREDDAFVRRFADGMGSSAYPVPRLSSIEEGVRDFHHAIGRVIPAARLATAPAAGSLARVNLEMGG